MSLTALVIYVTDEALAMIELFLFTAAIIQNFDIQVPLGKELIKKLESIVGFRSPKDKEFIFKFHVQT